MVTIADVQQSVASAQSALATAQTQLAQLSPTPPPPTNPFPPPPAGITTKILDDTFTSLSNWNEFYGPGVRWDNKGALPAPYSGNNTQPASDFNDIALYNPSQVALTSSGVLLTAVPYSGQYTSQGYKWLSGCLTSKNPLPNGPWYVAVRAKRPDCSAGLWPADWFLPANSAQEMDGYGGGFLPGPANTQGNSKVFAGSQPQAIWATTVDLSQNFYVYGYHFIPGTSFTVYFNGAQVWQYLGGLSQQAYYLFLQFQVAGPNTATWHRTGGDTPGTLQISEVQIWTP